MKKFVFTYHSDIATAPSQESLDAWNKWFATIGDHVVDSGNPTTPNKVILQGGTVEKDQNDLVGYSIVEANDIDEAAALAKDCPLSNAPGCAVRIYETGEM